MDHEAMREVAAPLIDAYETADVRVRSAEHELARAKEDRQKLRAALKVLLPEEYGEAKKNGGKKKPTPNYVSANVLEATRRNLARTIGTEFTAHSLTDLPGYDGPSVDTLKRALKMLHEHGELRLVRQLRGGQKVYEVIR